VPGSNLAAASLLYKVMPMIADIAALIISGIMNGIIPPLNALFQSKLPKNFSQTVPITKISIAPIIFADIEPIVEYPNFSTIQPIKKAAGINAII
jgi:hypothetical protein